jgi:hypothetical protein
MNVKVKAIIPKRLPFPKGPQVKAAINEVLDIRAAAVLKDHQKTTSTWNHKPAFDIRKVNQYSRVIGTKDKVWNWLNEGTRAHNIVAKRGGMLAFNVPFRAKTRVNVIASYAGGTGKTRVYRRMVRHPGTAARNWTAAIQRRENVEFPKAVRAKLAELNRNH